MKAAQLRELTLEELRQKHDDWQTEYFRMRVKHALGQLENPLSLRIIRKDIARAKTLLAEQGIDVSGPQAAESQPGTGSDTR
jgi:large subunit ribosomal protein L29